MVNTATKINKSNHDQSPITHVIEHKTIMTYAVGERGMRKDVVGLNMLMGTQQDQLDPQRQYKFRQTIKKSAQIRFHS